MGHRAMNRQAQTHIVIADDHPLFRGALRQAVAQALDGARVSEVGSLDALSEAGKRAMARRPAGRGAGRRGSTP